MNIETIRKVSESRKGVSKTIKIIEYRDKIEDWIKEKAMEGKNCCAYPIDGFWDMPYILAVGEELKKEGFAISYDLTGDSGIIKIGWKEEE